MFLCVTINRYTWQRPLKIFLPFHSSLLPQVIEFDDGSGSVLRIQPLRTHRDEAIYECTATNSAGEINTSAKLTVLEGKRSLFLVASSLPFLKPFFHSLRLLIFCLPFIAINADVSVCCSSSCINICKLWGFLILVVSRRCRYILM